MILGSAGAFTRRSTGRAASGGAPSFLACHGLTAQST
jgi:hypothetical protein